MAGEDLNEALRSSGLRSYQAKLVAAVLSDAPGTARTLVAAAGLGAARALVDLTIRFAERTPGEGVLVVVNTTALAWQFDHEIRHRTPAFEVIALAGASATAARIRVRDSEAGWSRGRIVI